MYLLQLYLATSHLRTHLTNKKWKPCHDVHVHWFEDSNERKDYLASHQKLSLFQVFKALDSSALRNLTLLCRKHGFTLVDKVYYLKKKLSISPFIKILEPLHVHIVHMASISYWSSVFSGVV